MHLSLRFASCSIALASFVLFAAPAWASDTDGPDDCVKNQEDWGDAPECFSAYGAPGLGPTGQFPTCLSSCGTGTQEILCGLALSTPPGPTGYVQHLSFAAGPGHFWLGCYSIPGGPMGIDSEGNGRTSNLGPGGPTFCNDVISDCGETVFGTIFGQDECYADGSDAGITTSLAFAACEPTSFGYNARYCGPQPQLTVFLNVLVDWTSDGDWNDNTFCFAKICAPEWAVKNVPIVLSPGCNALTTPFFRVGPNFGHAWLRVSLTELPVSDDYPWNGSGSEPGAIFRGGETEDYPVEIQGPTPARMSTWGGIKGIYR